MRASTGSAARLAARWPRIVAFAASSALGASPPAMATTLHLPDVAYHYSVVEQKLANVIEEFGRNLDLKVSISSDVDGTVQGLKFRGTAREFFERTMRDNNLDWYFDSGILYITPAKDNRTQLLVLSPISFSHLQSVLDSLDISDSRYPIRPAPGKGVVMTYGPPRYVALIEQTLAGLVAEEASRHKAGRDAVLMVFRGSQMTVFRHGVAAGGDASDTLPAAAPQPALRLSPPDADLVKLPPETSGSR